MKTIYVVGYYNHSNFGDDQYIESFKYLFPSDKLKFIDCDKLDEYSFKINDIVVVGGGDILNSYFMPKIIKNFSKTNVKLFAISVGIPYVSYLINNYNYLDIFSRIYVRTKQDINTLSKFYPSENIFYIPDISLSLVPVIQNKNVHKRQNICISVSRHIYNPNYIELYDNFILGLSNLIVNYTQIGYKIILVPFNTNSANSSECDIIMQNDIFNLLPDNVKIHVANLQRKQSISDINNLFQNSCLVIPMRFHACLFAIYNNAPIVPIINTRKIANLMIDINWKYKYISQVNNSFIPINFDVNALIDIVDLCLLANNADYLKEINQNFNNIYDDIRSVIRNDLICYVKPNASINTYDMIFSLKAQKIQSILLDYTQCPLYEITDENIKKVCCQIVSYNLTGYINSKYNYGLLTKMFSKDFNFISEWSWINLDVLKNKDNISSYIPYDGLYNIQMQYLEIQKSSNVHRSGWRYVTDNIKKFNGSGCNLPLLDLYIDRTFHWESEINRVIGVIPYYKPWYGIIHHTFDETFSDYNNNKLFQSTDFILSLQQCKGLIVLSEYMKKQIEEHLININHGYITVYCVCHPTEIVNKTFTMKKFRQNENKQIINIGGWLRNIYSFYTLNIDKTVDSNILKSFTLNKSVLKGMHMDNYYPTSDFLNKLGSLLVTGSVNTTSGSNSITTCDHEITNNWYKYFFNQIEKIISSVKIIEHVNDDDYDELLSENIVFLNLIDASAVNTLIECTVRNTPIIINKIPPVIEILGENYPLYYTKLDDYEINKLITYDNIKQTTLYLQKLDKSKFKIDSFMDNFSKIFKL